MRVPDVCFISWDRFPNRELPAEPIPDLAPDLAIEVLSASNTAGEMQRKLHDYFTAGVRLVWYIDPQTRSAKSYTAEDQFVAVGEIGIPLRRRRAAGFRIAAERVVCQGRNATGVSYARRFSFSEKSGESKTTNAAKHGYDVRALAKSLQEESIGRRGGKLVSRAAKTDKCRVTREGLLSARTREITVSLLRPSKGRRATWSIAHVLRVDRPGGRDVVGAGDDDAGVGEDG